MSKDNKKRVFIQDSLCGTTTPSKLEKYTIRTSIKNFIEEIEKNNDCKVVGMVYDDSYTIDLLIQRDPAV